ncbi:S-layer homology domain-containing protein, partial [Maledivibacter halophilus]
DGKVYVLGRDNYKLAERPYGFKFEEDSYIEKELIRTDGKELKIDAVGRIYLNEDDTKYYRENNIAVNAPNTLKVLLKDKFSNITEKEIAVKDKDEIIYGEVPDDIRDIIEGDKNSSKDKVEDEDIVITDPDIDEEIKEDIIDTINDTDVKPGDTDLNSGEGELIIDISDRISNKYRNGDYGYRLDIIKKENMKLVYTKILDKPQRVEIPKLQDSTTYIVRISILKGNKELAFKEIEKMTKDRTAPVIEKIFVRNNKVNVIAKDNIKLHSRAYKFNIVGKDSLAVKDGITVNKGILVAGTDNSLDIRLLASSLKWAQGSWQNTNVGDFDPGTKVTVTVRDAEGNWTQSEEILTDENGILQETVNPDDPLKVDKGSSLDIDEIIKKIIDELGENINPKDLDIKIIQGDADIEDGKIKIKGNGNIIVSIKDLTDNRTIQYLLNAVDDNDTFKRRIIVEKKSQTNLELAFKDALIDEFGENREITFETTDENISIEDYVLKANENGIGTITASNGSKNIKLYVIVADSISNVRSNIEKIDDNVAYTILKNKEIDTKEYIKLEGENVESKYLIIESDSKNIIFNSSFKFKAVEEGIANIRVIDLTKGKIRNINFKVVDIKPSDEKPKDTQNHWANESIERSISKGIVKGYEDNTFRPDEKVSTKEFLVMLNKVKLLTGREDKKLNSINLNKADWSYYEVANATMGIKEENLDFLNNNEWNRDLTREKAIYLISKILDIESVSQVDFTDIKNSKYTESIKETGSILKGYEDGSFKGNKIITRAEALTLISRILEECSN